MCYSTRMCHNEISITGQLNVIVLAYIRVQLCMIIHYSTMVYFNVIMYYIAGIITVLLYITVQ